MALALVMTTSTLAHAGEHPPAAVESTSPTQEPTGVASAPTSGQTRPATSPVRAELGFTMGLSSHQLIIASPEIRFYPKNRPNFSVDAIWNWSRALDLQVSPTTRGPADFSVLAHWHLARKGTRRWALATGVRFGLSTGSVFLPTDSIVGFAAFSTSRVGAEFDSPRGGATHGVYLSPSIGAFTDWYFTESVSTRATVELALEYSLVFKLGRTKGAWQADTENAIVDSWSREANAQSKLATTRLTQRDMSKTSRVELGAALGGGIAGSSFYDGGSGDSHLALPASHLSIASPEARFYLPQQRWLSLDVQWNWFALVASAVGHAADLSTFVHMRSGEYGPVHFGFAPGLQVTVGQYGAGALLTGRVGLDIQGPKTRTHHGVYLRPSWGGGGTWDGDVYSHMILQLEYTLTFDVP